MSYNKETEASAPQMESGLGDSSAPQPPPYSQQYPVNTQNAYPTTNNYGLPPNHPGYGPQYPQYPPAPVQMVVNRNIQAGQQYQSTFIGSIVVTLLCCWPIGILAIQNAKRAKDYAELNQPDLAEEHASKARRYIAVSIVGGIICIGIIVAVAVVRIMAINNAYHY